VVASATCTSIVGWFLLHVRLLWGGFCYMYVYCGVFSATKGVHVAEAPPTIDVHVAETTPQ
jgi:hypothetical protein